VHLLGVAKGRLVCTRVVMNGTAGTVQQYQLLVLDAATGNPMRPEEGRSWQEIPPSTGRGLLAGERIFCPTTAGLLVFNQKTGELVAQDPRIQGNLAAANGCLVAAGIEQDGRTLTAVLTAYVPAQTHLKERRAEGTQNGRSALAR